MVQSLVRKFCTTLSKSLYLRLWYRYCLEMIDMRQELKQLLPVYPTPRVEIFDVKADPKAERRARVLEIWNMGEHDTWEIAKMLNSTRGAIYNDLRYLGIKAR
jgi:DNA invertase Pin-like site-specific DNA recombinase